MFGSIFASAGLLKLYWLMNGVPGTDLTGSDIPKSLMLLKSQNPYSIAAWQSPYPPFLLMVDAGIIWLSTIMTGSLNVSVIASNIRIAGLIVELLTGLLILLVLRLRNTGFAGMLISTGAFLFTPAISNGNYFYFHSDVFGILLLAGSIFLLAKEKYFLGVLFLGLATIFKVQPILAVVLLTVWFIRRKGLVKSIHLIAPMSVILFAGLVLPLWIDGYSNAFLGFNLQNGSNGHGMDNFTIFNLFNGIFPTYFHSSFSSQSLNFVWIALTTSLCVIMSSIVWRKSEKFGPLEVIFLGLLVWLIPLRALFPAYMIWMLVPFLMLGRARLTIVLMPIFQIGEMMTRWAWNVQPNPIPELASPFGFFLTGTVFSAVMVLALCSVLRISSSRSDRYA